MAPVKVVAGSHGRSGRAGDPATELVKAADPIAPPTEDEILAIILSDLENFGESGRGRPRSIRK